MSAHVRHVDSVLISAIHFEDTNLPLPNLCMHVNILHHNYTIKANHAFTVKFMSAK